MNRFYVILATAALSSTIHAALDIETPRILPVMESDEVVRALPVPNYPANYAYDKAAVETIKGIQEMSPSHTPIVKVHPGEYFTIKLKNNAGTGYSWQLVDEGNKNLLSEAMVEEFDLSEMAKGMMQGRMTTIAGGLTERLITFQALKKGTATLGYAKFRPWDGLANNPVYRIKIEIE